MSREDAPDRRAVFLDRDGTLVEERGYVTTPEDLVLLPGAAAAVRALREAGWKVFVVSNQAAVARGLITEDELAAIHLRLAALLAAEGARLDGLYVCPHHPEGTIEAYALECGCRKPRPGLLEQAAREHDLDLARCVTVGDSPRDLEAGKAAGTRTVLVRTGHGRQAEAAGAEADHVADDLARAADWIISGA
ncbi:MAG TPA: HAD family hydrolase [Planctomycetota bacterium]|jgi:D-glycero-D-manno-heptose 1,7-bisphosphate phosphatase|nr:HAD family hydrolase [Planctomycetota bacterium]